MRLTICAAVFAMFGMASAQEMDMTPPAELKEMQWMLGEWKGDLKMHMGEETMTSKSSAKTTMGIGGRYVVSHQTYDMMGSEFAGLLLLTYDTDQKKWMFWWFDQMSASPIEFTADYKDNKLIGLSKPTPMPGMGDITYRATYEKKSDGKIAFLLEAKMGDEWAKVIEGSFSKA